MSKSKNKEYAKRLKDLEGSEKDIIAFKLVDEVPKGIEFYGDDISFMCAIVAEVWQGRKCFYITNKNVLCGGAVYAGIGNKKMTKEDFDAGMETSLGKNKAYANRQIMRRVNQQIPHHFRHYKENHFATWPVALYGFVSLMAAVAYYFLARALARLHGEASELAAALGRDVKGKLSVVLYVAAVGLAFLNPWIALTIYVGVAMMWFVPDRRFERRAETGAA